jgi:hypothetical protein
MRENENEISKTENKNIRGNQLINMLWKMVFLSGGSNDCSYVIANKISR